VDRIVVKSQIGSDGILQISLPIGSADAGREVQVIVEPIGAPAPSSEEWRRGILSTAGKWQGDFERPEQGEYEQRDLSLFINAKVPGC